MKDLSKTRSVDFYYPQLNKKHKRDEKFDLYPANHNSTNLFSFNTMSSTKQETKTKSPQDDSNDDLDSILDRLQNLSFDTVKEVDDKRPKLYETKKQVLDIIQKPYDDTSEFDALFEKTDHLSLKESVAPLTDEENTIVDNTLKKDRTGQVSQFKKVTVDYKDIYRLKPQTWLNDEVVNFYFELLLDRATNKKDENLLDIYCFNTFFCSTLRESGFNKVKRWTKRVDIFSKDLLFIPINQAYHWVLGAIDIKKKKVMVFDSLNGNHDHSLSLFLKYLQQEHLDKKNTPMDMTGWKCESPKDIPQQENMSDCGVYTCTFAERLSRNEPFNFSQQDMVTIRRRMVLNILNKAI